MSVWLSSILSHQWSNFSKEIIEALACAICAENGLPQWTPISGVESLRKDFPNDGSVWFRLPNGFFIKPSRKVIGLVCEDRWSSFLKVPEVRHNFLSANNRVTELTKSRELLILPEGNELENLFREDVDFEEIKQRAHKIWGGPDLDILRFYSEAEIYDFPQYRVHYFLKRVGAE